ncbi:MAG TPA: 3-hydroxyacyl-ACP dehydratase FabZ [Candidatus Binataceae bacterium]|nr:3-hydroxyacyl-ACP dehydratase FabZ [Candidatus Binataceae bacterium]
MGSDLKRHELDRLLRLLPHRFPFLLVDRVQELEDGRVRTLKNITINEPFFAGHFPGNPVMPGVLIIEALAQSAAILALSELKAERPQLFVLTGVDNARFRRPVVPGDQMDMEVKLLKYRRPLWKMRAEASVAGEIVAEAELSAMEVSGEKLS